MRTNMFFLAIVLLTSTPAHCMRRSKAPIYAMGLPCAMGFFGLPVAKTSCLNRTCQLVNMTEIEIAVITAWLSRTTECTRELLPQNETCKISLGPCNEAAGISLLTSWKPYTQLDNSLRRIASITFSLDGAAQAEVEDAFFKITTRPSEPADKKVFMIGWNPDHPCFASKPPQHGISSEQQHGTKRSREHGDDAGQGSKHQKLFHAVGQ